MDIVFASGLTDPSASAGDLMRANVEQPIGLIEATLDQKRFRYLTFGSVLETLSSLAAAIATSHLIRPRPRGCIDSLPPIRGSNVLPGLFEEVQL